MNQPVLSTPSTLWFQAIDGSDYPQVWQAMRTLTDTRDANTPDQVWLTEHPPLFTLGQAGKPEHVLQAGDIRVYPIDRGGQVTYHGPGQLMAYVLIDLKRKGLGVRALVTAMERSVIALMHDHNIDAYAKPDAPGVYVDEAKVAALGLRVRRGCSYHGLALNIDMDLEPYQRINPCGYAGQAVTDCRRLGVSDSSAALSSTLTQHLAMATGFEQVAPLPVPSVTPILD